MRHWMAAICLAIASWGLSAPETQASTRATVSSVSGSAIVMRGNKTEKLYVGAKIEPGDRVIVASGGTLKLSTGVTMGAGISTVSKTKAGELAIATTTSTKSSGYAASSPSSKLFSKDSSYSKKSSGSGKSSRKDDSDDDRYENEDDKDRGDKDEDEDDKDDKDEDDDKYGHGNPGPYPPVSYEH